MIFARLISRVLNVVSIAVLARLLMPEDFGLVATAWTVLLFLSLIMAFGFDVALVRKRDVTREDYDSVFTLNLALSVVSAAVGMIAASHVARFFGDERVADVVVALCFLPLIRGFHNIGVVEFRRELQFGKEFALEIFPSVVMVLATVGSALVLKSYWALVIGNLVGAVTGLVASYVIHPYRPRISLSKAGEYLRFSRWILLNNFLAYLDGRLADILISKSMGVDQLGIFRIGSQIATLTTTELVAPINRVLFPGYSKVSNDPERLKKSYLQTVALLVYLGFPIAIGISLVAEPLVAVLLGNRWIEVVPVLQYLAVVGALSLLTSNDYAIYMAQGRPKTVVYLYVVYLVLLIPALIYVSARYDLVAVAQVFLLTTALVLPLNLIVLFRALDIRFIEFLQVVWRSLLGTAMVMVAVQFVRILVPAGDHSQMVVLAVLVTVGFLVYVVTTGLSWAFRKPELSAERLILSNVLSVAAKARARLQVDGRRSR